MTDTGDRFVFYCTAPPEILPYDPTIRYSNAFFLYVTKNIVPRTFSERLVSVLFECYKGQNGSTDCAGQHNMILYLYVIWQSGIPRTVKKA